MSLRGGIFELRTAIGSEAFSILVCLALTNLYRLAVPDQDLAIRGGGTVIQSVRYVGRLVSKKNIFRPFGPQFDLKIREGGRLYPPGPSPVSATA